MEDKKVLITFGTRPEAIKMAPIVMELKKRRAQGKNIEPIVCVTAQHREMLDQVLNLFEIVPNFDLDIMSKNQSLFDVTSRVLEGVGHVMACSKPDLVLVQGDTTTTFASALAAYYHQIPVGHVEAGLRTFNKLSPFPEEMNRCLTGVLADYHFAPTKTAKKHLLQENVDERRVLVTGNTVIDSLRHISKRLDKNHLRTSKFIEKFKFLNRLNDKCRMILITGHRRESFGAGFENICRAIESLAYDRSDVEFVYPVHLNPNVVEPVNRIIGKKRNVHLLPPIDYEPFIFLMSKAYLILTDSGGIQEEAPGLGKPVLVMREVTERTEAVEAGTVRLVGTDREKIIGDVSLLLDDPVEYEKMSRAHNPYGDGRSAIRIADFIQDELLRNS
jgi:UDP-N-acetylglucosamine 2-epimerase (non-hydrolysing)